MAFRIAELIGQRHSAAINEACYKREKIEEAALDNPVSMRRDGNVAIITIDNPPVNALRHGVRKGILENVIAARDDASVEAIILTGAGRTFVAGADITEFGKPPQPPEPDRRDRASSTT